MWIGSSARCREIDHVAQTQFGLTDASLMARAGATVLSTVLAKLPARRRLAVICGKGNNGGDGLVVARLARERGLDVRCWVVGTEAELSPGAARELALARASGVMPVFTSGTEPIEFGANSDLVVDALIGTGTKGALSPELISVIRAVNESGLPVVAVDLPSGVDADTGEILGGAIRAQHTVTFGLPKPCFFQGPAADCCGEWTLADIGFPSALLDEPTGIRLIARRLVADWIPLRKPTSHKGDHGRLLIVAGSARYPGAAALAARGALRAGAGLVTVAGIESVCAAVAAQLPEVTLLPLPSDDGVISAKGARRLLDVRVDAAVIGPGFTTEPSALEFLQDLGATWKHPACLDADALNAVALGVKPPDAPLVFTPHPGEMARLMPGSHQLGRFDVARSAAEAMGVTVVLKGAHSVISAPGEDLLVNSTGNAGMASAGMGDVLSGVVGALLSQGVAPYRAAAAAAYWHGLAGDHCGTVGYLASELADRLPAARATITSP